MKGRNLLMIPGPIEFESDVLSAMSLPTTSHVSPEFIEVFGKSLEELRQILLSSDGQPFILAGSGTLAMDSVAANLVEEGDRALVISTGYFGDRFGQILTRYGAEVTVVQSELGAIPSLDEIEGIISKRSYKLLTVTHVDTSTGVLADVRSLAALSKKYGVLSIVDGVCSVAGEMIRMSDWEVDVVLTASQKAIGVPPGLALMVVSPKAIQVFNQRKSLVSSYYGDWNHWLPIMQSYESRKPAYFATPAVNLVYALQVSLSKILSEGIEKRVARHEKISNACKAGIEALGLAQVPLNPKISAHTMTAPRYVAGINPQDFLAGATQAGVILAGGLHPVIRNEYFRIGHMGSVNLGDILAVLSAVETSLLKCGLRIEPGISLKAAQDSYSE